MFLGDGDIEFDRNEYRDRRFFARFKTCVDIYGRDRIPERGCTIDISAQGIGLVSEQEMKVEAPIEICLRFPNSKDEYVASGKVAWSVKLEDNTYRVGVALEKPELMMIAQFLRSESNYKQHPF